MIFTTDIFGRPGADSSLAPIPALTDVVYLLHGWYPPATADSWDAVGLVAGDPEQDVRKVLLAVDPVLPVAEEAAAWGADLLSCTTPCSSRACTGSRGPRPRAAPSGCFRTPAARS